MKRSILSLAVVVLSASIASAQGTGSETSGGASSTASPSAENPNGGAATTGSSEPRVIAPSARALTTNPDGARSPASSPVDVQVGPGTSSGDVNGTSNTSADQPNK